MITFSNETHILFEHDGNFTDMLEVDVVVGKSGYIDAVAPVAVREDLVQDEGLWPDPDWPGLLTDAVDHSFTLNFKFRDNADQVSIEIYERDYTYYNKGWLDYFDYNGVADDADLLWSATFDNVEPGLYFVRISNPGMGWATLTNSSSVFWGFEGDEMIQKAEYFFIVRGVFGTTAPGSCCGRGNPPPGYVES